MLDLSSSVPAIAAAAIGLIVGALVVIVLARRWIAQARETEHLAREGEVAVLAEQRDAANARGSELARRVERFEQEWTKAEENLRALTTHAARHEEGSSRLAQELADTRRARDALQQRIDDMTRRYSALEATAREQGLAATEKLALLDQAEQRLRDSFQNLASSILDDKAERFREQSEQQLGGLLDPLKIQLKEFRESVTQIGRAHV